ncbi:MAG: nucleotidyl transferase AbiEii/AbiGii toxin family protein [Kofleriaceae bacterium]
MTVLAQIRDQATRRGESIAQAVRHHLLTGIIARVARSAECEAFVLRGGMLTRAWVAPDRRPTSDLDYVGDFAFSIEDTTRRFVPALAIELADDIVIDRARIAVHGMWLESAFPGVHIEVPLGLRAADQAVGVDIGFRDPLVPAATTIELPEIATPVRAVRAETQLAWKLHCLAEMGASWRPKDVADLWLITRRVPLEAAALAPSIEAAFTSRGFTVAQAAGVFDAPHWSTKSARTRWEPYRKQCPELASVITELRAWLALRFEDQP